MLEDSLARVALTRKELKDNVDVVKNEVRVSFGHHLHRLRNKEQQLLEKLDTVASVKDNILSKQQDQLHQALDDRCSNPMEASAGARYPETGAGACTQGLQWLQTAYDDLKTEKLSSPESIERRIVDVLSKYSSVDFMPRENSHISFESDSLAMRRAISSYGQIRTSSLVRNSESLPCALEDYEDENSSHTLSHKSFYGPSKPVNIMAVHKPIIQTDTQEWLLKEALTSDIEASDKDTTVYVTAGAPAEASLLRSKRSSTSCESMCHTPRSHHTQIHNWLHHMKTSVENEPTLFEDIDFSKKVLEQKNIYGSSELVRDTIFKNYFDQIIRSPDKSWLVDTGSHKKVVHPVEMNTTILGKTVESYQRQRSTNESTSDLSSLTVGNDSFCIVNSVGSCGVSVVDNVKTNSEIMQDNDIYTEFVEYWNDFLKKLWSSSDSMWLLPCASHEEHPVMLSKNAAVEAVGATMSLDDYRLWLKDEAEKMTRAPLQDNFTPPKNFVAIRQNSVDPGDMDFTKINLDAVFPSDVDRETWLLKSSAKWKVDGKENRVTPSSDIFSHIFNKAFEKTQPTVVTATAGVGCPATVNDCESLAYEYESALGWKAVLEKVHGLGDEKWLLQKQQPRQADPESEKQMWGYPLTDF
uniref:Nuclear receptor coactivator 4 n=1 Tax=Romanomermis culicivorax TaxID=13658 RepID=A0A915JEW3_ROMCU